MAGFGVTSHMPPNLTAHYLPNEARTHPIPIANLRGGEQCCKGAYLAYVVGSEPCTSVRFATRSPRTSTLVHVPHVVHLGAQSEVRRTQQVRDAGQYFVAAEISRRGGYDKPFVLNIISDDIDPLPIARSHQGGVQVKTKNHQGRWVTSTRDGQPREKPVDETTFWVMVDLSADPPEYYVVPAWWLENTIYTDCQKYLAKHGGQRPRNPDSTDWSIHVTDVEQWRGRWDVLRIVPMSEELDKG